MKIFLWTVAIVLAVVILSDRVCKVYEHKMSSREIRTSQAANPDLSGEQLKDYARAVTYRLEPYTVFGLNPNFRSSTVNINSLGLRGPEIEPKKTGTLRIAVLGGSAVFGGEVANDNLTFCGRMEERLSSEMPGRKIEVINAGIPAYMSMQELILLENKLIELKPDIVIIFDGYNDCITSLKRESRPNYPWWFKEIEKVYSTSVTKLFLDKKLRKYRPTKLLLNWLDERRAREKKEYAVDPEAVRYYARNLDMMCHLAASYGIKVIVASQPEIFFKSGLSDKERAFLSSGETNYFDTAKIMCAEIRDQARDTALHNDLPYIDCSNCFSSEKGTIFIDEVHFNARGHAIIGSALAGFLLTHPEYGVKL